MLEIEDNGDKCKKNRGWDIYQQILIAPIKISLSAKKCKHSLALRFHNFFSTSKIIKIFRFFCSLSTLSYFIVLNLVSISIFGTRIIVVY